MTMSSSPIRPSSSLSATRNHQHRNRSSNHTSSPTPGIINLASVVGGPSGGAAGAKAGRNSPRKRAPRQRQTTPKSSEPTSTAASGTTTPAVPSNLTKELAATGALEVDVADGEQKPKNRKARTRPASKSASAALPAGDVFDDVDHHGLLASAPIPQSSASKKSKQKGQAPLISTNGSDETGPDAAPLPEILAPSPQVHTGGKAAQKKNPKGKRGGRKAASEQRKQAGATGSSDENGGDTSLEVATPTQASLPAPIPISITPTSPAKSTQPGQLPVTPIPRHRYASLEADDSSNYSRSAPTTTAPSPFQPARPKHIRTNSNAGNARASGDEWDMPKTLKPEQLAGLTWQQQAALSSSSSPVGGSQPRRARSLRSRDNSAVSVAEAIATPPRRSARQTSSPFASSSIARDGRRSVPPPTSSASAGSAAAPTNPAMDALTWQQAFLQRAAPAPTALSRSSVYDVHHTSSAPASPMKQAPAGSGKKNKSGGGNGVAGIESGLSNLSITKPASSKKNNKSPLPPAYAGPQFHNSPSAAALPPPKFLSGASRVDTPPPAAIGAGPGMFSASAPNLNGWSS